MDPVLRNSFRQLLYTGAGGVTVLAATLAVLPLNSTLALAAGHLLSFLFVASHFPLIRKLDLQGHSKFLKHYFISMAARFLAVLSCFAAVLLYVSIDQILFTVSFIISYIFHSIIEMVLFNKILENRHVNR